MNTTVVDLRYLIRLKSGGYYKYLKLRPSLSKPACKALVIGGGGGGGGGMYNSYTMFSWK